MILAFAGGVGGARLAEGLARAVAADALTVAVNTGDDFEHLGLSICPDLDTVMYTLAGRNDAVRGWGLAEETWRSMEALERLGGPTWFRLGDADLATHLWRSERLRQGATLSEVTTELCRALGVGHQVVPMSNQPVRTRVRTDEGELAFQEWFVRRRCEPRFQGVSFEGLERACPSPGLRAVLDGPALSAIVVCPSNPWLSVLPQLALPGVRAALRERRVPAVAVSPIVAGQAVKGPLGKMLADLGEPSDAVSIARFYTGLVDVLVIDEADVALAPEIEALGMAVRVAPTVMHDATGRLALARVVLDAAGAG